MAADNPRWEWRTFGSTFGIADSRFAQLQSTGVQESDELYLLAPSGANVKIRDALMDIKVLRETSAEGLERWEPIAKQGFPLAAAAIRAVFAVLDLAAPDLARNDYTLRQFIDDLVSPCPLIQPVTIHKRRVRYRIGDCLSEVTEVRVGNTPARTIAIESEDAGAVVAAVKQMGLEWYLNTSYPRGLQALLDEVPERYAVIDAGTNSIKFLIAERASGGLRTLVDRAGMTRLGEGLDASGEISPAALARTADAIAAMVAEATQHRVLAIAAVGTAGLRIARNRESVLAGIRARTGIAIDVISGEDEARLAYRAATAGLDLPAGQLVVLDTGGGSSQFTFGTGVCVDERFSVEVGAVRYTEHFGLDRAVPPRVLDEALAAIAEDLSRLEGRPTPDLLVGMGGAITNIAAVKHGLQVYDPDIVQGTVLERAEIDRQIELYRSRDTRERRAIVGLQPGRAEVILAGACIVRYVMDKLGQHALTVSDRGLRHGVLVERFGASAD